MGDKILKIKRAVFLDRDGVINVETSFIIKPEELQVFSYVPKAIKRLNDAGFFCIVVTNQSAIARGLLTERGLHEIHDYLRVELSKERACLDAIYYCPHHPDKTLKNGNSQYLIECDCRKPKSGLIDQACRDFEIDLEKSFLIGDSERDLIAAKNRGVFAIAVTSGLQAMNGYREADRICNNLKDSVDYILESMLF